MFTHLKRAVLLTLFAATSWAQCSRLVVNPTTGKLDCIGPSSALPASSSGLLNHAGLGSVVTLTSNTYTAVYSFTASSAIGAGGCIQLTVLVHTSASTLNAQVVLVDGTSTSATLFQALSRSVGGNSRTTFRVCNRAGSTTAQDSYVFHGDGQFWIDSTADFTSTSLNLTSATWTVKFQVNPGVEVGDTITLYSAETELLK